VRSLQLTGLDQTASQEIIGDAGLDQTRRYQPLVDRYSGNPLALKIVAATIRSIFNGDVAKFLDYGTVVFGDLWDLLDQQFARLSTMEQTVMRWLAINREWTSLKELRDDIIPTVSHRALLEAVESLKARSLVETSPAGIVSGLMVSGCQLIASSLRMSSVVNHCHLISAILLVSKDSSFGRREVVVKAIAACASWINAKIRGVFR
jgi:hypothetical protein